MSAPPECGVDTNRFEPDDLRSIAGSFETLANEIEREERLQEESTYPCAICGDPTELAVQKRIGDVAVGLPVPYCEDHRPEEGRHAI